MIDKPRLMSVSKNGHIYIRWQGFNGSVLCKSQYICRLDISFVLRFTCKLQ